MKKVCLALAAVVAVSLSSTANAGFQVTLDVDGTNTTIVDGGVGDNDGVANNQIGIISETVGGYTFNFTLAMTNTPGTPTLSFVNASTGSISGSGAATVSIFASANDFTDPSGSPLLARTNGTFQFLSGTVPGNSADFMISSYLDTTNALSTSAAGTTIGTAMESGLIAGSGAGSNVDLSDEQSISIGLTPYALNFEMIGTFYNSGQNVADLDGQVEVVVPEPATMIMWGSFAAMGVPAAIRRRRRQAA